MGDGVCDGPPYFTEQCGLDDGDCDDCPVEDRSRIGDGFCDGGIYNTEECGWDGRDCAAINAKHPDCKVDDRSRIGDGICDGGIFNTEECGWDGRDCLDQAKQDLLANLYPDCAVPPAETAKMGDGVCDGPPYFTEQCGLDDGDCEDCPVEDRSRIGDGFCDGGIYNTEECGWDGSDCVAINAKYPDCKSMRRLQHKLLPNDGSATDLFGFSLSMDGDTIVVGAPWDDDNGRDSGSAYVFTRDTDGTAWRQQAKLLPDDGAADDMFGYKVAVDGDSIVVGARWDDDNGEDSGSAYVFSRDSTGSTTWRQQAKLLPDDGAADDEFGGSVAVYNDTIVVGAYYDDDNGDRSGSAYVFTRDSTDGTGWKQKAKLLPNDGAAGDQFGFGIAIYGDTIVVGAEDDDDNGLTSGSVYVFDFC